jgi:hypothetical protein
MAWVDIGDPRFAGTVSETTSGGTVVDRMPGLEFYADGALTVGRSCFGRDDSFELDFHLRWLRRRGELLQLDNLTFEPSASSAAADDPQTTNRSLAWKSALVRYRDGRWQAHLPGVTPDRAAEFWAAHGYWLSYVVVFGLIILAVGTAFRFLFDRFPWLEKLFNYLVP